MAKVYKIQPAIGIMRVGNSPDAFFIGPEVPGLPGVEINGMSEVPVQSYKANGRIKRQAARFRVFEYDQTSGGGLSLVGEVTAADAEIEWKVELVNRKAAGNKILVASGPRNPGIPNRDSLIIRPGERQIKGAGSGPVKFDKGQFLGQEVFLGELRTDSAGRLMVLGGHGKSEGIPAVPNGPLPPLGNFANNDRWYDDVADGPVTAKVTFRGQASVEAVGAWVLSAPPDFAPGLGGVVSLYEVALQAAITRGWLQPPTSPSFRRDIFPTLARSTGLRWVHEWASWEAMPHDWAVLSDKSDPAHQALRQEVFNVVTDPGLNSFEMPAFLREMLVRWVAGNFVDDWNTVVAPPGLTPDGLNQAALEACIGANFFPGIEAGSLLKNETLYAEPLRLSHQQVAPGGMTEVMALPWQADFHDCSDDWWPSQRPNDVFAVAADVPNNPVLWAAGVQGAGQAGRLRMVRDFGRLGFIVPKTVGGDVLFIEAERDPNLPGRP